MKKSLILVILAAIFVAGLFAFWKTDGGKGFKLSSNSDQSVTVSDNNNEQGDIIYYYGARCPHCINLNKFIAENQIDKKVSFQKKEVWDNKANSDEMMLRVKECGINPNEAGVPFLYARGKCYIGGPDVENFFKQEAGI